MGRQAHGCSKLSRAVAPCVASPSQLSEAQRVIVDKLSRGPSEAEVEALKLNNDKLKV